MKNNVTLTRFEDNKVFTVINVVDHNRWFTIQADDGEIDTVKCNGYDSDNCINLYCSFSSIYSYWTPADDET